jgi:hypothetical protein
MASIESTELPGRLIVDTNVRPELGSEIVVKLAHGWYHGTILELGSSVLVGGDSNFIRCRAVVQDPMYLPGEPNEPEGQYDCLEWDRAMWSVTRKLIEEIRTSHQTYSMMQRAAASGLEHIVGVGIRVHARLGSTVYQLSWPARHHTILHMLSQTIGVKESIGEHDQGFMTSSGRYVSRTEAAKIARAAGQTVSQRSSLFSEDLW